MESTRTGRMIAEVIVLDYEEQPGNRLEQHGLTVELVDLPEDQELAAAFGGPTDGGRIQGYQVTGVEPGSAGAIAGAIVGDWLLGAFDVSAPSSNYNPGLDLSEVAAKVSFDGPNVFRTLHDEESRDECLKNLMDPMHVAFFGRRIPGRRGALREHRTRRRVDGAIQKVSFCGRCCGSTVVDCGSYNTPIPLFLFQTRDDDEENNGSENVASNRSNSTTRSTATGGANTGASLSDRDDGATEEAQDSGANKADEDDDGTCTNGETVDRNETRNPRNRRNQEPVPYPQQR